MAANSPIGDYGELAIERKATRRSGLVLGATVQHSTNVQGVRAQKVFRVKAHRDQTIPPVLEDGVRFRGIWFDDFFRRRRFIDDTKLAPPGLKTVVLVEYMRRDTDVILSAFIMLADDAPLLDVPATPHAAPYALLELILVLERYATSAPWVAAFARVLFRKKSLSSDQPEKRYRR